MDQTSAWSELRKINSPSVSSALYERSLEQDSEHMMDLSLPTAVTDDPQELYLSDHVEETVLEGDMLGLTGADTPGMSIFIIII
jgi:hypothetical protein